MNDAAASCVIQANPDIAGIGVRISIYVQACTALIPAILSGIEAIHSSTFSSPSLSSSGSHPRQHHRQPLLSAYTTTTINWRTIQRLTTPNLALGYCLFLTSLIQALTSGLSIYHALILLNLHVIIAFSLSPYLLSSLKDLRRADCSYEGRPSWVFVLAHVGHVSCTGAFGIWVFATLNTFDRTTPTPTSTSTSCTSSTLYSLLIKNILISHSAFRRIFLVLCSFLALPLVNTIVLHYIYMLIFMISLFALSPSLVLFFVLKRTKSKLGNLNVQTVLMIQLAFVALAALSPQILMIIATERTILANTVGAGEGRWTLGQTVALAIAILPIREVVGQVRAMAGRIRERTRVRTQKRGRWKGKAPARPRPPHPSVPPFPPFSALPDSLPTPYAPAPVPSLPTLYEPATYSHPGELQLPVLTSSSTEPVVEIPMINITHHDV
ncbi:hypothetical protein BD410DRAFT_804031 [Rickenella mellea]|uniref:Uncharacterized protein n=1 Tax=Rickenella mellea TaxID=50990 RepID=A0A4Y7Q1X0_9AGAM|nr:hypothetical protein BD410DRAFT_804031 [Rickenella mellea]